MKYWKYQGIGNDFVLLDGTAGNLEIDPGWCERVCDRHCGVGADGVLYVLPGKEGCEFTMRIINADGSEAEMCGNGIRCVAKYVRDNGLTKKNMFKIWTLAGKKGIAVVLDCDGTVKYATVNMGEPVLEGREIPIDHDGRFVNQPFEVDGVRFNATAVSMGNPHFVIFDDIGEENVRRLGPVLEKHPFFPRKTNVEFAKMKDGKIYIDVYERGAAWTLACGTGACATTVAACLNGLVREGDPVDVHLPGGWLTIKVEIRMGAVYMEGPAKLVSSGEIFVK